MNDVRAVARAALAVLEQNRRRIDDLNVYPVPDGDTGTNLTLTLRAVVEALDASSATDAPTLAREATRAALMGARGNSGVIFSQILRGAVEVVAEATSFDGDTLARALRGASDAAYRAVRRPVEGTMLTVIRELAEEGEAQRAAPLPELLAAVVARGERAVAETPLHLEVLREAGVVDAGGAGLLEIVRGAAAALADEPLPEAPPQEELTIEAVHQEQSRFRYCTTYVVEGDELDADALEAELEPLGDSLLVVGDATALKVHVHTDDPGAALSLATRAGVVSGVEIANMHAQTAAREERLLHAVPDEEPTTCDVVAVVAGDGNARLFTSLGATRIVAGGQTMNPSTAELVAAIEACRANDVVVLPNNSNVVLTAEQAEAAVVGKRVEVVHAETIPAGLAAMVAYDSALDAAENAREMAAAVDAVATGEVTVASRDVRLDGLAIRKGSYLGLAGGEAVAGGDDFDDVAGAVIDRLLQEPRGVLTLLTGADEPRLDALVERVRAEHPELEVDVQEGGQPHYPLLVGAE